MTLACQMLNTRCLMLGSAWRPPKTHPRSSEGGPSCAEAHRFCKTFGLVTELQQLLRGLRILRFGRVRSLKIMHVHYFRNFSAGRRQPTNFRPRGTLGCGGPVRTRGHAGGHAGVRKCAMRCKKGPVRTSGEAVRKGRGRGIARAVCGAGRYVWGETTHR